MSTELTQEQKDAAAAAKFDAAQAAASGQPVPPANAERPEGLPEKFNSWADMAAAYAELEKKLGAGEQKPAEKPAEKPQGLAIEEQTEAEKAAAAAQAETDKAAAAAVEQAGLDMSALRTEFAQHGDLTKESREKLHKIGFSDADIDSYIEGQVVLAERERASALADIPGGEDTFAQMLTWAKQNLSREEIIAYNKATGDGVSTAAKKLAVDGLYGRYSRAVGQNPNLIEGGNKPATAGDIYESRAQMVKDMQSAQYKTDPAFRNAVAAKLARSNIM